MATNALAWFAGQAGELRESLAAGAVTEVVLSGAGNLVCHTPSGRIQMLPANATKAAIGPLDECGIWQVINRLLKHPQLTHRREMTAHGVHQSRANRSNLPVISRVKPKAICRVPGEAARFAAADGLARRLARAADLVLSGRRSVALGGGGVVPLSTAVDQLMDGSRLVLELTHPVRLICLAVVPLLLYYFYRSLVDFPAGSGGFRSPFARRLSCCSSWPSPA